MEHSTGKPGIQKEARGFGPDTIEAGMHTRVRDMIEAIVEKNWTRLLVREVVANLAGCHLGRPVLAVIDGNPA